MTQFANQAEGFEVAEQNWQLKELYLDLAKAKGKSLTPLEKKILRGLLCGYSPAEISEVLYGSRRTSSVRVYLSNGLYKYIQELLIEKTGKVMNLRNWSQVTNFLTEAGYKIAKLSDIQPYKANSTLSSPSLEANLWQEQLELGFFVGREAELQQLENWIIKEKVRAVAVLGRTGVGKTSLLLRVVENIRNDFEALVWLSLEHQPAIDDFLVNLIQSLSNSPVESLPLDTQKKINILVGLLRHQRFLLIFNQFDSIFQAKALAGTYLPGYEDYGNLLAKLTREIHSSCLVITSRAEPEQFNLLTQEQHNVKCIYLKGLDVNNAIKLIETRLIVGSQREKHLLVNLYQQNPLALKIVLLTIKKFFNSSITEFLSNNTLLLRDIKEIIDQQFQRLSKIEKRFIYGLVISRQAMQLRGIGKELNFIDNLADKLKAIESLQKRSLIDTNSCSQDKILHIYVLQDLLAESAKEISNPDLQAIVSYILQEILWTEELTILEEQ